MVAAYKLATQTVISSVDVKVYSPKLLRSPSQIGGLTWNIYFTDDQNLLFFNTDFDIFYLLIPSDFIVCKGDRRGRDCKVVGFTTTYAINVYHH